MNRTLPSVLLRLATPNGGFVPPGSEAVSARQTLVVGYDGQLWVPGEAAGARFTIDMGGGRRCSIDVPIAQTVEKGLHAEPLVCR